MNIALLVIILFFIVFLLFCLFIFICNNILKTAENIENIIIKAKSIIQGMNL